jgi:hypothetical protein
MTGVAAVGAMPPTVPVAPGPMEQAASIPGLPEPLLHGADPQDALGMLLMTMERMSQTSVSETQARISVTRDDVRKQLAEYLAKMREALQAAREARHDDGFFEGVVGSVADAVGEVVGTFVDLGVDLATQPFDVGVALLKNPGNPQALFDAMRTEMEQLATNGDTAESVRSFTRGAGKLCGAVADFAANVAVALERAAVTGESAWEGIKKSAVALWKSFEADILKNPGFWDVASALGRAAVIAGAAASGGTLGLVAVALLAANEAENRYGLVRDLAGEDASRWIKIGLQVAGAACAGWAATGGELDSTLGILKGSVAVAQGANALYAGVRSMQEADKKADDIERQADIQGVLNRMQRLQRLMDDLVGLLEDQSKRGNTTREIGNGLVQTQAAMQTAAIMRA